MPTPSNQFLREYSGRAVIATSISALLWIVTWLAGPLAALITLLARGYAPEVPWVYAIAAAALSFACVVVGTTHLFAWVSSRSARDKLLFLHISLGANYTRDTVTGLPSALEVVQFAVNLRNVAPFPMSYIVEEITSSAEEKVNPSPMHHSKGGIIGAASDGLFRDAAINMERRPLSSALQGRVRFRIRYGHPGAEKYTISRNVEVVASLVSGAGVYSQLIWSDLAQ